MPIQYYMRAYNTTLSRYVDWVVNDQPDSTGEYSTYNPSHLTNIVVNRVVQSKIENFFKIHNLPDPPYGQATGHDGYFLHLNSNDWIHPSTPESPAQIVGLAVLRDLTDGYATVFWDEDNKAWKFAYNTDGDGVTVGESLPVTTGDLTVDGYLAIGTDPAQSGIIRIPNSRIMKGRNSSNTDDVNVVEVDSSNRVKLGSTSDPVYVTRDLIVGDNITHGLSGASTTGFLRLQNTDEIRARSGSKNLVLLTTVGDSVYLGDTQNIKICYHVGPDGYHRFFVNDIPQLDVGAPFIRFSAGASYPTIYQDNSSSGNGQSLIIKAQTTTVPGSYGGSAILSSGHGVICDGYVDIRTGTETKIRVFGSGIFSPATPDYPNNSSDGYNPSSIVLFNPDLRFYNNIGPVSIKQDNTTAASSSMTIQAQTSTGNSGGNLVLSSGNGSTSTNKGKINLQIGTTTQANLGITDSSGVYFDIGTSPAQSGILRIPNNTALKASRNGSGTDLYVIGTDTSNRVIIGNSDGYTVISGSLEVMGQMTVIDSQTLDITDRVIHVNNVTSPTHAPVPLPTLITGLAVHRGTADGYVMRDHTGIVWNELDGYWKFAYVSGDGYDTLLSNTLPIMSSFVVVAPTTSGGVTALYPGYLTISGTTALYDGYLTIGANPAQSGALRISNNITGAAARNSSNTGDVIAWKVDSSNLLMLGTTRYNTEVDGYNLTFNAGTASGHGDILFDTNGYVDHVYFDGVNKNLFVNLMGSQAYLKANSRTGAYIDLPGRSSTTAQNFAIDGYHVDGYVTAGALSNLCNGSNADGYHTHASSGGSASVIMVGALGALPTGVDGYLLSNMTIATGAGDEDFPAYVMNAPTATVKRLVVTCSQLPAPGETVAIIVRNNKIDTLMTVILDSSTPAGTVGYIATDLVNSFSAVVGDWITVHCLASASGTVSNLMVSLEI